MTLTFTALRTILAAITLVVIAGVLNQAKSASFDCAKASSEAEKAVCNNANVSALDEQLAAAYKSALARSQKRAELRQEQRAWIKLVRDKCSSGDCLVEAYTVRISDLSASSLPTAQNKKAPNPLKNYAVASLDKLDSTVLIMGCQMSGYPVEQLNPIYIKSQTQGTWQMDEYKFSSGCGDFKIAGREIVGAGIVASPDRNKAMGFIYFRGGRKEMIRYIENF